MPQIVSWPVQFFIFFLTRERNPSLEKKFEATSRRKDCNELPCQKYLVQLKNESRR